MPKSIYKEEYTLFLRHLRRTRERAGITQEQLAQRLAVTQTHISKCERGERRIDIIELRDLCKALHVPMEEFVRELEKIFRRRQP